MSKTIKVQKVLSDFYESFSDEYYMSQVAVKLQTDYELEKRIPFRTTVLEKGMFDYIEENGLEATIETLWAMHLNGYEVEEEIQKYKIVVDEFSNTEDFVIWNAEGEWVIKPDSYFYEDEFYKKTFTMEEIIKNFPALVANAEKAN